MKVAVYSKNNQHSTKYLSEFKKFASFELCDLENTTSADYIVAFGGDGSTLKCIPHAIRLNAPIIAVNTGNLGFLSAYSPNEIELLINDINEKRIEFAEKKLLQCEINSKKYFALNEVVVERDNSERCETNTFSLHIDGVLAEKVPSDGFMIATPTGSTAYSLSAGGPVLHPQTNAFIATSVCSHATKANSIVYPQDSVATITIESAYKPCLVFSDGILVAKADVGQTLTFTKAPYIIKIAKRNDFFAILNNKFQGWSKQE